MFEGKTCHGFTFAVGLLYVRHIMQRGSSSYKFFLFMLYPMFIFETTFNFGRHLGLFSISPSKELYLIFRNYKYFT